MAIPTQFSVTNKRSAPLANPTKPIDNANPLTAEDVGFISGASVLPAKSAGDIGAPSELSAQPINDVDNASLFGALSAGTIDNPSVVTAESIAPVDNASVIDAENEASISTPTPLAANPATQTSGVFPLNHARILYENVLFEASNVSATSGQAPGNARIPNTWQRWTFGNGGEIIFEMPAQYEIDTVCIGSHNLSGSDYTIGAEWSPDSTGSLWYALAPGKTPLNNDAIMFHFSVGAVNARRIRVLCSGNGTGRYIGYISAGVSLQMQRPFFNGHQPYTDSDVTEYYSNRTESGEIIGRQIRRKGYETTYEWQNIDDNWYRNNIPEFKESAKKYPMFIAWNLLEYPNDVAFGETTGDIAASMQNGTRTKRTGLSFTLKGV